MRCRAGCARKVRVLERQARLSHLALPELLRLFFEIRTQGSISGKKEFNIWNLSLYLRGYAQKTCMILVGGIHACNHANPDHALHSLHCRRGGRKSFCRKCVADDNEFVGRYSRILKALCSSL